MPQNIKVTGNKQNKMINSTMTMGPIEYTATGELHGHAKRETTDPTIQTSTPDRIIIDRSDGTPTLFLMRRPVPIEAPTNPITIKTNELMAFRYTSDRINR
jgi:hypothetical protein